MSEFVDGRVAHATGVLQRYLEAGEQDTALLRELGRTLGQLRGAFTTDAGGTDWGGRSAGYRAALGAVYDAAGVAHSERRQAIMEKVRYHIHAWLREMAPVDELIDAGIKLESRSQRYYRKRLEDPVKHVVDFAQLVDDTYTPEGVALWWASFAAADRDERRRLVVALWGLADGVFV